MKKQIVVLAVLFITVMGLNAQKAAKTTESNFGIKGGYNLASVKYDGEAETGQRHGFNVGFYGESFINEVLALQIEFQYSQQGYEIRNDNATFTQNVNYINLPLLFNIYPNKNFFFEVGPQIGLAISHKEEYDSAFNLFDTSQEFNPNKFDYGVNFGVGFKTDSVYVLEQDTI
uniref:porin family protein n=1 Tax=Lacinutrix neustonica TaxID=2980107 RepID=UPI0028BD2746|nr:porin family protein [Lacinutrix neustonica]